jgi:hypothetical protein
MRSVISNPRIEVPEDVLSELDVEERRLSGAARPPTADALPEEVKSELDREARVADEDLREQLVEGQPPAAAADDDRAVTR